MTIATKETKVKRHSVIHALITVAALIAVSTSPAAAIEEGSGYHEHMVEAGYRAVSTDDDTNPVRTREYDYLHSSPTGKLLFKGGTTNGHYNIKGSYLNEKDFDVEADFNYGSIFRLNLFSQSLFHNLEHIPYDPDARGARSDAFETTDPLFDPAGSDPTIKFSDADPDDTYGTRILQNRAETIFKLKTYPAHVRLQYWRLDRSGSRQMHWVDEGAGGTVVSSGDCGSCHMQSRTRDLDNVTEEFTAAVDAHLGGIDLILEQTFRQFHDDEPIPRDVFGSHNLRDAGTYQHDEMPDSRLTTTTVKAHTSLSGGFVAAGSVTFGKRENRSDLADVRPVESETTYVKGAGDVTWIPTGKWTLNLRYRALDMENDSTESITADGTVTNRETRNNVDLRNYDYVTTVAFRPSPKLTLKAEGEYEETCRSNTGGPKPFDGFSGVIDPVWELPDDELKTRFKLSVLARPLDKRNALKLRSWYQYQHSNDPAYGSSIEDGHVAFLGAEWHPSMRWGIGINARAEFNENRNIATVVSDGSADQTTYFRDRDSEKQNLTAMFWANPTDSISLGAHYGYLRTRITQDLLFGSQESDGFVLPSEDTDYTQWVQTASANTTWRLLQSLTARAEGRYVRSHAAYDPEFLDTTLDYSGFIATATSEGLRELSKVDIRQFGGSASLDWRPSDVWRTTLSYTYDKYDDLETEIFDGKVETYMVSLARTW